MQFQTKYNVDYSYMKKEYPTSKVVLDPTCTLEQILNRAMYGMAIPQRDISGDITSEELSVLGISGNDLGTMSRMELVDLRIKAQMRMNAIEARKAKLEQAAREKAYKQGVIDEYIQQQKAAAPLGE